MKYSCREHNREIALTSKCATRSAIGISVQAVAAIHSRLTQQNHDKKGKPRLKRLVVAFVAFAGLIGPGSLTMAALVASPARPEARHLSDCGRELADARAIVATMRARNKNLSDQDESKVCAATQLFFLEVVRERAVTASCKSGPERDRELRRFDADVARINNAIAARCL